MLLFVLFCLCLCSFGVFCFCCLGLRLGGGVVFFGGGLFLFLFGGLGFVFFLFVCFFLLLFFLFWGVFLVIAAAVTAVDHVCDVCSGEHCRVCNLAPNAQTASLAKWCGVRPESGRPGFASRFPHGSFPGSSHTSDLKLVLQWLPCQAPGVIRSVLGVVGSVSACRDWVRSKVSSTTSVSVCQLLQLSE